LFVAGSYGVASPLDLGTWLREQCSDFTFDVGGVFQRSSDMSWWPLEAAGPAELEERLTQGGHLLPLPREPAALANVLEVSIVNFLTVRALLVPQAQLRRGNERGYPDLEISGPAFGGGFHAVDVKAARRAANRRQTQSRITLYTGNTYFKWPDLHWPGTFRPFSDYATHLDVIMIYTLNPESNARVEDLEIIVQEPWRVASRERSSTTREYIGAVTDIAALRSGAGAFAAPAEFYDYWRRFPFKVSPQVQTQLQRLLKAAHDELTELRKLQQPGADG
jgi:Restriction endonuclease EcoRV